MTNYTNEEKQHALNEAHELMKSDEEKLKEIKDYIDSAISRHTTPILNEKNLKFLIGLAEKGMRGNDKN